MKAEPKGQSLLSVFEFLRAGRKLKPVPAYAFVGKEEYFRWQCVRLLKAGIQSEEYPGSTVREYGNVPDVREVLDQLRTAPFLGLSGYRLVVMDPADKFIVKARSQLEDYLAAPGQAGVLVLSCDTLRSNTRLYKAISRTGVVVDCSPLNARNWQNWLNVCAARLKLKLTPDAVRTLGELTRMKAGAIESELEKLAVYRLAEGTITRDDVTAAVSSVDTDRIFMLLDCMNRNDSAAALEVLQELLFKGTSVQAIVAMLARNYGQLWEAYRMRKRGLRPEQAAGALSIPPWLARKLLAQVASVRDESCFVSRLIRLSEADLESKTQSIYDESRRWIEGLVAELSVRR